MAKQVYVDFDDEKIIQYIHYDDGQPEEPMNTVYEDTCVLHCTDNDQELTVEILGFRPEHYLKVSIERSFALNLQYQPRFGNYVGSVGGREFTTNGPKGRTVRQRF